MTDEATTETRTDAARTDRPTLDSLADPTALIDREGVEYTENPIEEHANHFDLYEPIQGIAIAGTTNDDGAVLLLVDREAGNAVLPHARVEPGEDWVAAIRRRTEDLTGVPISIDGAARVRRNRYRPEAEDDDREAAGHDVVFRASPADDGGTTDEVGTCEDNRWEAEWAAELPDGVDVRGDVLADLQSFLD